MSKQKKPLFSDEYLNELSKEISQLYGDPESEQKDETKLPESKK